LVIYSNCVFFTQLASIILSNQTHLHDFIGNTHHPTTKSPISGVQPPGTSKKSGGNPLLASTVAKFQPVSLVPVFFGVGDSQVQLVFLGITRYLLVGKSKIWLYMKNVGAW